MKYFLFIDTLDLQNIQVKKILIIKIEHISVIEYMEVSTADPRTGCASGQPILHTSCTTCPSPRPICHHPVSPRSTSL